MELITKTATFPALNALIKTQLKVWPEHERYLNMRFEHADFEFADQLAKLISRVIEAPEEVALNYKWMCEQFAQEELSFLRSGHYRITNFAEAEREIYSNHTYMHRYMHGILFSHLWWNNHARAMEHYVNEFLPRNKPDYHHLEIGPGHGLLLYFAANDARCKSATGWDVSETSVAATQALLTKLNASREARVTQKNAFETTHTGQYFDSIVISEVLEHLENPQLMLEKIREYTAPSGRVFINVPVNSPAPDHIYLLRSPEEAVELVRNAGYNIEDAQFLPMTGFDEKRARKLHASISCVIVATPSLSGTV